MKQKFTKFVAAIVLAAGGVIGSTGATAAEICDNCAFAGDGTFLGVHNPLTTDSSGFRHRNDALLGLFEDDWVFYLSPAGLASVNGSFQLLTSGVTGFTIRLYEATATGCSLTTPASLCASHTLGDLLATSVYSPSTSSAAFGLLALAGDAFYVIRVSGTANPSFTQYSGQLQTRAVPEPGALALLGLGLAGIAAIRRRRMN